jgi:hypothetical protein
MIFCRTLFIDSTRLFQLLRDVIALTPNDFVTIYDGFRRSFEQSGDLPLRDDFVRRPLALVNQDLRSPNPGYPGIDLPCWIEALQSDQTLVLLGQDPLRDDRYFTTDSQREVVLGTPYSAHSATLRERYPSRRYWTIIRYLHGAGYNLYLTDVRKFWPPAATASTSAVRLNEVIFNTELSLLRSSGSLPLVIAFGKQAAGFLLGADFPANIKIGSAKAQIFSRGGIRVLPVLHPSPQNQGALKGYLRANDVDPDQGVIGIAEVIAKTISRFRSGSRVLP